MTLGERMTRARKAKKLTQQQLADLTGMTKSAISQIEIGTTKSPTPENLFKIADALRMDARQIVFGKEAKAHQPILADIPNDELTLLNYYRRMSEEKKKAFVGHAMIVRILSDNEEKAASRHRFDRAATAEARSRKQDHRVK